MPRRADPQVQESDVVIAAKVAVIEEQERLIVDLVAERDRYRETLARVRSLSRRLEQAGEPYTAALIREALDA